MDDHEDPAEGWAMIETFAAAALPQLTAAMLRTLKEITDHLPTAPGLLHEHLLKAVLPLLYHRLGVELNALQSDSAIVRKMMREHYRHWPHWHGPRRD